MFYFDNNATTHVAQEVVDAMLPVLTGCWANPSSPYRIAREAAKHLGEARDKVAALVNADEVDYLLLHLPGIIAKLRAI